VLPGQVKKPKDKASVENTVGSIATWLIAAFRNQTFATLPELRAVIRERMTAFNAEPFQKRADSRQGRFKGEEKPLVRPLPAVPVEISR